MKQNTKHTPGLFSISGISGDNHIMAQTPQGKQTVAIVAGWSGVTWEEIEANKRLFAAAPDLLAALEYALQLMTMADEVGWDEVNKGDRAQVVIDAEAAIAKAKGQP